MMRGYKQYTNSVISAQAELNQKLDFITPGLSIKVFASTTRNSYSGQQRSTSPFYYSISYYDKLTDTYTLRELNLMVDRKIWIIQQKGIKSAVRIIMKHLSTTTVRSGKSIISPDY